MKCRTEFISGCDGIGRHARFRFLCASVWVRVPSSALVKKSSSHKWGLLFLACTEGALEPTGSLSPRCKHLRRSVRRENGPPDLFLFPPHPSSAFSVLVFFCFRANKKMALSSAHEICGTQFALISKNSEIICRYFHTEK